MIAAAIVISLASIGLSAYSFVVGRRTHEWYMEWAKRKGLR